MGQSYVTSVFSTLWAFVLAVLQVLRIRPDIVSSIEIPDFHIRSTPSVQKPVFKLDFMFFQELEYVICGTFNWLSFLMFQCANGIFFIDPGYVVFGLI